MMSLRSSVFALMLGAALPANLIAPARAQVAIDVSVEIPPPILPYYEQPIIPAEGYIWVPGYWAWDPTESDYYWVPGTWVEPPQPELLWTPAYWGWVGGRYVFHPGYWGREVGFYGGINYGYGYAGEGYFGGRWDHGVFFYNRTVNNVTNVRITNVYNQTVVVNDTINRVSFNGGNGGTTARPTPQQEAFARERHVEATPIQRQHIEAASRDRALFSKQNHGEPAVAATPRAGVLQGEGVMRASRTPVNPAATPNREPGRPEELPRPGQEPPRATERGREPSKAEKRVPAEEPRREPQEVPRAEPRPGPRPEPRVEERRPEERPVGREPGRPEELPRPGREPPCATERGREPSKAEKRVPTEVPRREPQEVPRAEPRPGPRPEPRVEERRPAPPAEAARPSGGREPPPRMAPAPRPPAAHSPEGKEEKK